MTAGSWRPSRRDLLAGGPAALAGGRPALAAAPASLAAAARARGLRFGAAAGPALFDDEAFRALFLAEAAVLTPENALKIDALQPEQGRFDFAAADRLVDFAAAHGLHVRGHTLIWNDVVPAWLKALGRREVERTFDSYIDTVAGRYAGRLHSWDVVNEPFWLGRDHPGTFSPGPWFDALGPGYVARAFRRAAAADGHAALVLNEAWTERSDPVGLAVRRALLRLVDTLQDSGVKLDAVGLQAHLQPGQPYDAGSFADFLNRLAERRVAIALTELDVDDASFPDDVAVRDRRVADWAGAVLRVALAVPEVTTVVCWGLSDRYTWLREPEMMVAHGATRLARPLPYDDLLRAKPMRAALLDAFVAAPAR